MTDGTGEDRGLSARQLLFMFLAGVAVCAVFFAAGYLVGYNEGASKAALSTEQVAQPQVAPPTVNTPLSSSEAKESSAPAATPETTSPAPGAEQAGGPAKAASNPSAAGPANAAPSRAAAAVPLAVGAGEQGGGKFTIQVLALSTMQDAQKVVGTLNSSGYTAFLVPPQQAGAGDNLYRVQVGPFSSRDEAERVKARLIRDGFKQPFVKQQ